MITLLPEQTKKKIRNLYRRRVVVTSLFFFAWLTIVCIVFLIPTLIMSNEKKTHLQEQLLALENTTATTTTTTPLRITVASINKKVGLFTTVPQKSITVHIVDALVANKPKGIIITDIQIKLKEKNTFDVSLVGTAENRDTLGTYAKQLEEVSGFTNVTVPLNNYLKGTALPMTIELQATI